MTPVGVARPGTGPGRNVPGPKRAHTMAYGARARTSAPAIGATASLLAVVLLVGLLLDGLAVTTAAPASAAIIAAPRANVSWKDAAGGLWSKGATGRPAPRRRPPRLPASPGP